MANIYALLVGINDYAPEIGKLQGCINDVDHFHEHLTSSYKQEQLRIEVLKDAEATRDNIIRQFRDHLCQAGPDDVALFQYCGHGARWASAPDFLKYFPDGKDEGIVCYDSRHNGAFDLADKELAVLLAEVAARDPHMAIVLDCCHSGSATRSVDDFTHLRSRQTHEVFDKRPLESYLDGYYEKLVKGDKSLHIPTSRHVLMAACERVEKAWESKNHSGVFSDTLMDVLQNSGGDISYADLFVRCRAAVHKYADNQNPQFESYGRFNAHGGFLGKDIKHTAPRFSVYFKDDEWKIDCGALHGLPTDTEKDASLALYSEADQDNLAGYATTVSVGAQKSDLALDFEADPAARYRAELISLPVAPIPVHVSGDVGALETLNSALDPSIGAVLTDIASGARYAIVAKDHQFLLRDVERDLLIQGAEKQDQESAEALLAVLKNVIRWERSLALQNKSTELDTSLVDFWFAESLADGSEHAYEQDDITLEYVSEDITGNFYIRNRTPQKLHFALMYFSPKYGISVEYNDEIPANSDDPVELFTDPADKPVFFLDEGADESIENLKLFVTTEKVDDFLLVQDAIELGEFVKFTRGFGRAKSRRKKMAHKNEWFTKALRVTVARQCDRVGKEDASLANNQITVKAHPAVSAGLSLSSAKTGSRSTGAGPDIYKVMERIPQTDGKDHAFELVNLSGTRGDEQSVLELSNIENSASLQENPLEIALNLPLQKDEYILPLTFDGDHILLGGEAATDDSGQTLIKIHEIPDVPNNRRSLGGSLKLYFFKTYLKKSNLNKLRWVEYRDDGTIKQHTKGVDAKVTAADNIVLLVHGIIGDTAGMAKGLPDSVDEAGQSVRDKFDLVLTYDYENLATPIEDTALDLGKQLTAAGLTADDDKRLTFVVHSMGGLVSRWFIEKLGGNAVVDHLVMCGTPNNGSPYGQLGKARKLLGVLATVALNVVPFAAPFCTGFLYVINRSKKLTPCLEQMDSSSKFMQQLNAGDADPGIPYTILAGNVSEFEDDSDMLLNKLLDKVGKGSLLETLFGTDAHDIAVSRESIRSVPDTRKPAPLKTNVACHHLNHFVSAAGLKALSEIDWQK